VEYVANKFFFLQMFPNGIYAMVVKYIGKQYERFFKAFPGQKNTSKCVDMIWYISLTYLLQIHNRLPGVLWETMTRFFTIELLTMKHSAEAV